MAYFGSSQEEGDLDEEEQEEEEELRTQSDRAGSGNASASSSCHSTPRKGRLPGRQPLNGHGKDLVHFTLHVLPVPVRVSLW